MHICDNIFNSNHATCHMLRVEFECHWKSSSSSFAASSDALILIIIILKHGCHSPGPKTLILWHSQSQFWGFEMGNGEWRQCRKCATILSSVNNIVHREERERESGRDWLWVSDPTPWLGVCGVKMTKHLHDAASGGKISFVIFYSKWQLARHAPCHNTTPATALSLYLSLSLFQFLCCVPVFVARASAVSVSVLMYLANNSPVPLSLCLCLCLYLCLCLSFGLSCFCLALNMVAPQSTLSTVSSACARAA